jgi:putative redox protein
MSRADQAQAQVIARVGARGLATEIQAGEHRLRGDETIASGGTGTGLSPYDFLLASLGSCTAMTLRLYADRKNWPLEGVVVALDHNRIYAEDCADCEKKTGRIDVIERRIELLGPLSDAQRTRLREIADHCPVHRSLTGEIKIRTTLAT